MAGTKNQKLTRRQKVQFVGVGGVVAFLIGSLIRFNLILQVPKIEIPMPTLPAPNAHDTFTQAAAILLDRMKISDALLEHPFNTPGHLQKFTLIEKRALVIENAPCLKLFRKGLDDEYMTPPIRSFMTPLPYLAKFRSIGRALALEAQVKEVEGNWKGAMDSRMDCIELGVKMQRGSPASGFGIGISIQRIGMIGMADNVNRLNVSETRATKARLKSILSKQVNFQEALAEEKWFYLASSMEAFRTIKNFRDFDMYVNLGTSTSAKSLSFNKKLQFMLSSKPPILAKYSAYSDSYASKAKRAYPSRLQSPPLPDDVWIQNTTGGLLEEFGVYPDLMTTNQRLLTTFLALHLYQLEHGAYPPSLETLVPNYLEKVPEDSFSVNAPLKYRHENGKVILYSVGPDGVDDGGKPIDSSRKATIRSSTPRARYEAEETSNGDIVAGVNAPTR